MKLLILLLAAIPSWGAFTTREDYTPGPLQVSNGPHSNFTVRISVSAQTWAKTTGNGGKVQNASGYDIVPNTTSDCSTFASNKHAFKRIRWDGTAGDLEMDVFVASFAQATIIYICVGDSAVSTDQQTSGSIDSTVKYRFDMEDSAANTIVTDSTTTANGANAANTSGKSTTGRIGRALTFNGSSDFVAVTGATSNDMPTGGVTVCLWAKAAVTTGTPISRLTGTDGKGYGLYNDGNWYTGNGTTWTSATADRQSDSAWHYYCLTHDGTNIRTYRDGSLVGGPTALGTAGQAGNAVSLNIGRDNRGAGGTYFSGDIDEVYKADAARSADWLLTEYNMGTQSSFWSVTETDLTASSRRRIFIIQ